VSEDQHAP